MSDQRDDHAMPDDETDAVKRSDAAVRRALVEARQSFLAHLRQRLGNLEEAEEVLQRFTLRALERASELRDIRSVRSWLGRILMTAIADHQRHAIRKRRRETAIDQAEIENVAADPASDVEGAICECLYKLLPTLKPEYAEVVWRADLLDEPRDRIAVSLSTTLNNVTVRLHRGRQALKKRLEEMCLTCPVHGFLDCRCDEAERIRQQQNAIASEGADSSGARRSGTSDGQGRTASSRGHDRGGRER
jgi:RNA polymerase sigma-70 factor (ECF subfamily)